jgi:hypothetical protein
MGRIKTLQISGLWRRASGGVPSYAHALWINGCGAAGNCAKRGEKSGKKLDGVVKPLIAFE